jgi:hypothetical protein
VPHVALRPRAALSPGCPTLPEAALVAATDLPVDPPHAQRLVRLYTYENFTDAASKSLQAVEAALKARLGRRPTFAALIDEARARRI